MGFRFNKRINLGKGFGLNLSKSGARPSYRNKRGSISSKGYSLKTGIPGLSYRKTFKKSKNNGCLVILISLLLSIPVLMIVSCEKKTSKPINQWYQGGTLHKAKISDWKNATDKNKLATCGDFCAKIYENNSLDEIKLIASDLRICIDEAIKGHNTANDFTVSEVASMCLILLKN